MKSCLVYFSRSGITDGVDKAIQGKAPRKKSTCSSKQQRHLADQWPPIMQARGNRRTSWI